MRKKKNVRYKLFVFVVIFNLSVYGQLYYKDVAGIFYNRCTSCHRPNGGAPISLLNYAQTFLYKSSILNELFSNHMPPWPADTSYVRFIGEHTISLSEKQAIIYWLSTGALKGDTTLAPNPPIYPQYKLNGVPDLELKMPTFVSNASPTTDAYNVFALPTGLTTTRTIRAIEFVPGNPNIVHHAVVMADGTGNSVNDLSGNAFSITGNIGVMGYQPGAEPVIFPNSSLIKAGIDLPAGSQILFQMHYPAGSAGEVDSSKVRIYFYPQGTQNIRQMYIMVPLQYWRSDFWIAPPNTSTLAIHSPIKSFTQDSAMYDTFPISLFSALPHSHQICTDVLNFAYEDTTKTHSTTIDTIPLLRINEWNFHWQFYYYYKKLVKIPPGYRYFAKHTYDNTSQNPHNPNNPPQMITVGTNSGDEMLYDSFQWLVYNPGDENINIDSIIKADPLFVSPNQVNINENKKTKYMSYCFPNPSTDKINICLVSNSLIPKKVQLVIFDVLGDEVFSIIDFNSNVFTINKDQLKSGVYFYEIISSSGVISKGKFLFQ